MDPDTLRRFRARHKLSQARLAHALGVHVMTVSQWERGLRPPPTMVELALAGLAVRLRESGSEQGQPAA